MVLKTDQKSKCAVFYTTDEGYLFPTLVSALAVKRQLNSENAEVRIIYTGRKSALSNNVIDFLSTAGIILGFLEENIYSNFDIAKFNKTHVPISTMARFFMLDAAPGNYERIIYLDGDTWINSDIKQLLEFETPPGYIAASEGASFFYRNDIGSTGDGTRQYFKDIGIDGSKGYFNAGVLLANKDTWRSISMDAFRYFIENIGLCKYHDESALNAVASNRRVRLSPRWNFASPYWDWGVHDLVSPAIFHFAGGIKPWRERVFPFESIYDGYLSLLNEMDHLGLSVAPTSSEVMKKNNQKAIAYRVKINSILLARKISRRKDMAFLVQNSAI